MLIFCRSVKQANKNHHLINWQHYASNLCDLFQKHNGCTAVFPFHKKAWLIYHCIYWPTKIQGIQIYRRTHISIYIDLLFNPSNKFKDASNNRLDSGYAAGNEIALPPNKIFSLRYFRPRYWSKLILILGKWPDRGP